MDDKKIPEEGMDGVDRFLLKQLEWLKPLCYIIVGVFVAWLLVSAVIGIGWIVVDPTVLTPGKPPPNLYELTRQTAENTRQIFWLIVVCFAAWSFRSYQTGK
jgi:hypothetical protein